MKAKSFKINVVGRVQGVGFRYFTKKKADELGLFGRVKNLYDGSVEIHIEGDEYLVLEFLEWCHDGPSSAIVNSLSYIVDELKSFKSFEIIR